MAAPTVVGPAGVFKADGLDALDDLIGVKALGLADLAALLHGADAVLSEDAVDLVDSSFVAFKQSHCFVLLLLFLTGVDILGSVVELAVVALGLLQSARWRRSPFLMKSIILPRLMNS